MWQRNFVYFTFILPTTKITPDKYQALGPGGGDSHIKRAGMLVVPRFWYRLGCSKQNTYICIQHGTFKGCHDQLMTIDINIGLYKLLVFIAINSFKLIVCLYVSDWYLLGVKFRFSHTQIGTFLGVHLKFPDEHPRPFYMESFPPSPGVAGLSILVTISSPFLIPRRLLLNGNLTVVFCIRLVCFSVFLLPKLACPSCIVSLTLFYDSVLFWKYLFSFLVLIYPLVQLHRRNPTAVRHRCTTALWQGKRARRCGRKNEHSAVAAAKTSTAIWQQW